MIRRFLVWLNYTLRDWEDAQDWRPIVPSLEEVRRRIEEDMAWVKSLNMIPLEVQCAMYGHRYDRWFENGLMCLTCGQMREVPIAVTKDEQQRHERTNKLIVALQLRPETIAEAQELRKRLDAIARHR